MNIIELIATNLDEAIEYARKLYPEDSELVVIKARLYDLSVQTRKGLIQGETRERILNKIRHDFLNTIKSPRYSLLFPEEKKSKPKSTPIKANNMDYANRITTLINTIGFNQDTEMKEIKTGLVQLRKDYADYVRKKALSSIPVNDSEQDGFNTIATKYYTYHNRYNKRKDELQRGFIKKLKEDAIEYSELEDIDRERLELLIRNYRSATRDDSLITRFQQSKTDSELVTIISDLLKEIHKL